MVLNVSRVLNINAFQLTFTILQQTSGTWTQGEFNTSATNTLTFQGSIQPISTRDRLMLPEDERVSDAIVCYVKNDQNVSAIRVGNTQTQGDIIQWHGINYMVKAVNDWKDYGHYRIFATRVEGQSS